MKKSRVFLSLLVLTLVFIAFIIRRWNEPKQREAFDRHPAAVVYGKDALCYMDCRRISREEIAGIIDHGSINFNKSNRRAVPCPIFALQGLTQSGKNIRVIFAQCPAETKVIACYNFGEEPDCRCAAGIAVDAGREEK